MVKVSRNIRFETDNHEHFNAFFKEHVADEVIGTVILTGDLFNDHHICFIPSPKLELKIDDAIDSLLLYIGNLCLQTVEEDAEGITAFRLKQAQKLILRAAQSMVYVEKVDTE